MKEDRLLRLTEIIGDRNASPPIAALIPISKTAWYEGIKAGRFPKPIRLGPRTTVWRLSDLRSLITSGVMDSELPHNVSDYLTTKEGNHE